MFTFIQINPNFLHISSTYNFDSSRSIAYLHNVLLHNYFLLDVCKSSYTTLFSVIGLKKATNIQHITKHRQISSFQMPPFYHSLNRDHAASVFTLIPVQLLPSLLFSCRYKTDAVTERDCIVTGVFVLQNGYDRSSSVDQRNSSLLNDSEEDDDDYDNEKETVLVDADTAAQLYANVTPTTPTNNTSFTVRHMRVVDWPPERSLPSDKKTLLTLHSQLMECQQSQGKERILVHCL